MFVETTECHLLHSNAGSPHQEACLHLQQHHWMALHCWAMGPCGEHVFFVKMYMCVMKFTVMVVWFCPTKRSKQAFWSQRVMWAGSVCEIIVLCLGSSKVIASDSLKHVCNIFSPFSLLLKVSFFKSEWCELNYWKGQCLLLKGIKCTLLWRVS